MSAEVGYRLHRLARSLRPYDSLIADGDIEAAVYRTLIEHKSGPHPVRQVLGRVSIAANIIKTARYPIEQCRFRVGPISLVPNYSSGIDFIPDQHTIDLLGYEPDSSQALALHLGKSSLAEMDEALPQLAELVKEDEIEDLLPVILAVSYDPLMAVPLRKGMREVEISLSDAAQRRFAYTADAVNATRPHAKPIPLNVRGAIVTTREFTDHYSKA